MAFVKLDELRAKQETHRVTQAWGGDIRINRLKADDVMDLIEVQEELGELGFALEFCARTLAGEDGQLIFNTDDGRAYLRYEFEQVNALLEEIMDLHGMNENEEEKKSE